MGMDASFKSNCVLTKNKERGNRTNECFRKNQTKRTIKIFKVG